MKHLQDLNVWLRSPDLINFFHKKTNCADLIVVSYFSHCMGKPTICIGENKGADQLRSNCEADQRLCIRYMDSTIPLLPSSGIQSS